MVELDPGKLTSVDEYGHRKGLIVAEVQGYFRKRRDLIHLILIGIFLFLPWLEFGGRQVIFFDIINREFSFFGLHLKAHDAPLLIYVILIFTLSLLFVTAVWGRLWCGWTCPQTVFIDSVYRKIEHLVEGNHLQRRALKNAPWTPGSFLKSLLKWFAFVVVSFVIAHSFLAYFVGAKPLISMMGTNPQQNWGYFLLAIFFTGLFLFDFAWFREQFCIIMCPYGRMQSLMLDSKSMAVVYDIERGEPRKNIAQKKDIPRGACVSCQRCVQVCPTGIDIRNGLQMECISCSSCIDACDEIMDKVNQPRGLIRYATLDGSKRTFLRPRPLLYLGGTILLFSLLIYSLGTRKPADFTLLRGKGLPYTSITNPGKPTKISNQFRLHIQNQSQNTARYKLSVLPPAEIFAAENPITVAPNGSREWYFFIILPEEDQHKNPGLLLSLEDLENPEGLKESLNIKILGPQGK